MVTNLDKAKGERDAQKSHVKWLHGKISIHPTTPLSAVEVDHYLQELEQSIKDLKDINLKVMSNVQADQADDEEKEYFTILDSITKLQVYLKRLKAAFPATIIKTPATPSFHPPEIKLPRLEIPTFDGSIQSWIPFRDMFTAAVGKNTSLSNVQKLTYLVSTLSGEAARQVRSLPITDANYNIAWNLLEERYHNERELLFSILRRFTGQSTLHQATAVSLRTLIDVSKECMRSLEVLSLPVKEWDAIILFLIYQKLDSLSRELWEQSLKTKSIPSLKEFLEFLEQRASALAATGNDEENASQQRHLNRRPTTRAYFTQAEGDPLCKLCSGDHMLFKCNTFLNYSVQDRSDYVKRSNRCFNCLRYGHSVNSCSSKSTCKACNKYHHTLLHRGEISDTAQQVTPPEPNSKPSATVALNHFTNDDNIVSHSILATAQVCVRDSSGQTQTCRALLDSGSSSTFISDMCLKRLGLKRSFANVQVTGLGSSAVGTVKGSVNITVLPHFDTTNSYNLSAFVLTKVTGKLPVAKCDPTVWPHLQGLQLADPYFHVPAEIDILFGADLFFNILQGQQRHGPNNTPVAIKTSLGWLIGGKVTQSALQIVSHYTQIDLEETLEKFWKIESVPEISTATEDEQQCDQHFNKSYKRDSQGRFVIRLPFKQPPVEIGQSRDIALRRLKSMEKRLAQQPKFYKDYVDFMTEYKSLGHMREVTDASRLAIERHCYIPHHYVLKECSTTTKFRVVFDASAKTSSGYSLNNSLLVGPVIQDNLTDILMRFRTHFIAFTADIEKMYRQIRVAEEDVCMQRILWRDDPNQAVKEFELLTVTYGTAPAPYLATKSLEKLSELEHKNYPLAAKILKQDFYMDDCMSGESELSKALKLQQQLNKVLEGAGFYLRKWASNSQELLESIPPEQRELQSLCSIDDDKTVKTLGIHWNPSNDEFNFKVNIEEVEVLTKRTVLSELAKLFDPLGWLAPTIIKGKIYMQNLWKLTCQWDTPLPTQIQQEWKSFFEDLNQLEAVKIPRCINPLKGSIHELIGFSDASERAYSAVVYLKTITHSGTVHVALISSKTKVAPVKSLTLPRLELCGAVLLSTLMRAMQNAHRDYSFRNIFAFTDSTITLAWIQAHPSKWKTFVQNRVAKIQGNVTASQWRHVAGKDNPADCASRGISATELASHPLWWTGPSFLYIEENIPFETFSPSETEDMEERPHLVATAAVADTCLPLDRFSSFTKLMRVTAWVLRFCYNIKQQLIRRKQGPLSQPELDMSLATIVKTVQQQSLSMDYANLKRGQPVQQTSKLKTLAPFMDENNCIRVGGRIQNAPLSRDQRHPYVLPRYHTVTSSIILEAHLKSCHGGPQLLQCTLQQKYWILRAKDAIRFVINKCVRCIRHTAKVAKQLMGDLPQSRVNPARPFSRVGVDFAGPILIKPMVRSKVSLKVYIAIFICMCTRAIHIELVSALSTDAFLACLRRFMARRGKPTDMYSDQGTNFVGCARVIVEMQAEFNSNTVHTALSGEGITWHFNPPSAPHFGGLWEAGVKSTKFHLFRVIGSQRLTFEELSTVLCQIESILNSRPLTPFSTDPADLTALTPGHFLIGAPLTSPPEPSFINTPANRLTRWQLLQQMQQSFWNRWYNEFITRLQQRPKWTAPHRNIQVDDMVIVKDERLPPLHWKLGRVTEVFPGKDDRTRVVNVKTSEGCFKRPIHKLCLLPFET